MLGALEASYGPVREKRHIPDRSAYGGKGDFSCLVTDTIAGYGRRKRDTYKTRKLHVVGDATAYISRPLLNQGEDKIPTRFHFLFHLYVQR